MDRKEFIRTCGFACIGGTALVALLESCATTNYFAQAVLENNQLVIRKSEFVKSQKANVVFRKYILVKTGKMSFPICIYRLSEENYSAVLMQCSHQGCELQAQGEYLVCPCHGSEFTNKGVVQQPPAEKNLQTFKIITDNENIYIHI